MELTSRSATEKSAYAKACLDPANWHKVGEGERAEYLHGGHTIYLGSEDAMLNHVSNDDWAKYPSFRHAMQAAHDAARPTTEEIEAHRAVLNTMYNGEK